MTAFSSPLRFAFARRFCASPLRFASALRLRTSPLRFASALRFCASPLRFASALRLCASPRRFASALRLCASPQLRLASALRLWELRFLSPYISPFLSHNKFVRAILSDEICQRKCGRGNLSSGDAETQRISKRRHAETQRHRYAETHTRRSAEKPRRRYPKFF